MIRPTRNQGQARPRRGIEEPLDIDHVGRASAIKDLNEMSGVADRADDQVMALPPHLDEEQDRSLDG